MKYLGLGKRLKRLREEKALSLDELAEKTSLPRSLLESFESEGEVPRIAHLIKLSKVFDTNVANIFRDRPPAKGFELLRRSDRSKKNPLFETEDSKIKDYAYEPLSTPSDDKHMEAFLIELPPFQSERPMDDLTHPGEEFIYVLEGRIEGRVSGERFSLGVGDSLYLRSNAPHCFYNPGSETAKAVTVIYPF